MSTALAVSHVADAAGYVRAVLDGKIPACRWVRLACERHERDLARSVADPAYPYAFDEDAAETVCEFIEHFRHIKGKWARAGQYIRLEPWQSFIVCSVFGWKRRSDGARRFRISYTEVARKNAKSTTTSGIGNYLVAADNEEGAHVVSAATTRDQARIVFSDSQAMARKEPDFLRAFGIEVTAHAISQLSTSSKYEAISAEDHSLDGLNIHAALIDELHAHRDRGVWDVLETATGSRFQPLIWAITTAGTNRAGVCYDQHLHVTDILSGTVEDDSYFGIIYTIDEGDDPFDETSWQKANPNWGVSVLPENFRSTAARARSMPSMQTAFLTKHLCVWANAGVGWLPAGAWDKLARPALTLDELAGNPCYVGIDLASRSDLAAVALLFPPHGTRRKWALFAKFYLPSETVERAENTHYQGWERTGRLTATEGAATDCDAILDDLLETCGRFEVREVASDPWKNLPLMNALQNRGVTVPKVDVRQTLAVMSPAMKEFEALVVSGAIEHDGDPVLAWNVANTVALQKPGENIYPSKDSPERKIDGVLAALMALDRALREEATPDFATRGLYSV